MIIKKIYTFIGFGFALFGGYFWMINQVPLSLILWGLTFLIIIRLNRLNKGKNNYKRKK